MKAESYLNIAKLYLSGFNEVSAHKNASKTVVGLLKIFSYIFIFPPIVFGYLYWKNKKITDLQNNIDSKIDKGQVGDIFANTLKTNALGDQKILTYLVNKLLNFEKGDDETLEKKRFGEGFKQLSFDLQGEFFKRAYECKCVKKALQWIPQETSELNFISGPPHPIHSSKTNKQNVIYLLDELTRLDRLKKIQFNLKGLGFYTPNIDKNVYNMSLPGIDFSFTDESECSFNVNGTWYSHCNDAFSIIKILAAIREMARKNSNLKWNLSLMNGAMGGQGVEVQAAANLKGEYVTHLMAYFRKK